MSKDTNAQESLGRDFQRTAPKSKLTIEESLDHIRRFSCTIKMDYDAKLSGSKIRYETKKKKKYVNDGVPPLKRTRLSGNKSKVITKADKLQKNVDWGNIGIPWGFTYHGFVATNTCPLDTVLMAWYLLSRYGETTLPEEVQQTHAGMVLIEVMNCMDTLQYDKARWLWCTQVLNHGKKGKLDLYDSIDAVFYRRITALVRLPMTIQSSCDSDKCPEATSSLERT
ncbi:hypothetical protein BGW38_006561, partial [Lunasporangiospora selenospora]